MEAFLLAAGLGTRLKPLTNSLPKPMIDLGGMTLIDWNLRLLAELGAQKVVVNTHYLYDVLEKYLGDGSKWGIKIVISREVSLLDTGGGLKNAWGYFKDDNVFCFNSDIFIDPRYAKSEFQLLKSVHNDLIKKPLITILLREDKEEVLNQYGKIGISSEGRVVEFLGTRFVNLPISKYAHFTGVSILSRELDSYLKLNKSIFSLTRDLFSQVLHHTSQDEFGGIWSSTLTTYWNDVGTIDRLKDASKYVEANFTLQKTN